MGTGNGISVRPDRTVKREGASTSVAAAVCDFVPYGSGGGLERFPRRRRAGDRLRERGPRGRRVRRLVLGRGFPLLAQQARDLVHQVPGRFDALQLLAHPGE